MLAKLYAGEYLDGNITADAIPAKLKDDVRAYLNALGVAVDW
jgi:hypothetical protein